MYKLCQVQRCGQVAMFLKSVWLVDEEEEGIIGAWNAVLKGVRPVRHLTVEQIMARVNKIGRLTWAGETICASGMIRELVTVFRWE